MEQEVETMETADLLLEFISFANWVNRGSPSIGNRQELWTRHRKVEAEINKRIPRPELPDDR